MYFFSLRANSLGQPTFVANLITPEECASIIRAGETTVQLHAGKTEDHRVHENLRKSEIGWLNPDGDLRRLFAKVRDCVSAVNVDWFRYDLTGFEGIQFTKYSSKGELAALKGAERSLKRWRPKLAISFHHRPEDFSSIPLWLNSLNCGYCSFLDHYTIHHEETVMYAKAWSAQIARAIVR